MTKQEKRMAVAVGKRLSMERRKRNVSPEGFCLPLEISPGALRGYERGGSIPGGFALKVLADEFNRTTDWILGR